MSDQINNQTRNTDHNSNSGNILRELSDIKESLATNTAETKNIKESLAEVKSDVKEIRKNYITQEQHAELVKNLDSHSAANCLSIDDHEKRIRDNEKNITRIMTFGSILIVLIGIIEFLINQYK